MSFQVLAVFSVSVVRKGYEPHMSVWYTVILGILTFVLAFLVLFVTFRFRKELKKRGLKERDVRRRKKTHRG